MPLLILGGVVVVEEKDFAIFLKIFGNRENP